MYKYDEVCSIINSSRRVQVVWTGDQEQNGFDSSGLNMVVRRFIPRFTKGLLSARQASPLARPAKASAVKVEWSDGLADVNGEATLKIKIEALI